MERERCCGSWEWMPLTLNELMLLCQDVAHVRILNESKYYHGAKELYEMLQEHGTRVVTRISPIYFGLVLELA